MPLRSSVDEEKVMEEDPEEPVPEDVTMDENPGAAAAQDGGSNEFRTDR